MLSHPLSILGWILFAAGFFLLFSWVPTDVASAGFGLNNQQVFNAHKAEISKAVMLLGATMAVVGTVAKGFETMPKHDNSSPSATKNTPSAFGSAVTNNEALAQGGSVKTVILKDIQGRDREVKIGVDGSAIIQTITGVKKFPNLNAVKTYLD